MTKADLSLRVWDRFDGRFSLAESANLVEPVLTLVKETLRTEGVLKISGFGGFFVRSKNNRRGRNPVTGDQITIASHKVVTFKASKVLKVRVAQGATT